MVAVALAGYDAVVLKVTRDQAGAIEHGKVGNARFDLFMHEADAAFRVPCIIVAAQPRLGIRSGIKFLPVPAPTIYVADMRIAMPHQSQRKLGRFRRGLRLRILVQRCPGFCAADTVNNQPLHGLEHAYSLIRGRPEYAIRIAGYAMHIQPRLHLAHVLAFHAGLVFQAQGAPRHNDRLRRLLLFFRRKQGDYIVTGKNFIVFHPQVAALRRGKRSFRTPRIAQLERLFGVIPANDRHFVVAACFPFGVPISLPDRHMGQTHNAPRARPLLRLIDHRLDLVHRPHTRPRPSRIRFCGSQHARSILFRVIDRFRHLIELAVHGHGRDALFHESVACLGRPHAGCGMRAPAAIAERYAHAHAVVHMRCR